MIAVGVPLMILAGIATYFNSRASVARQSPEAAANPQTAMMNKLALYVFPLGVVVGGPFLPLAIILYWVANNIWTFGQQHYVFGKIEKEEEAKKPRRRSGARRTHRHRVPSRHGSAQGAVGAGDRRMTAPIGEATEDRPSRQRQEPSDRCERPPAPSANNPRSEAPGRTPRPGAKPKKRKR